MELAVHQLNCSCKDTAITSLQVDCDTFMSFLFPIDVK